MSRIDARQMERDRIDYLIQKEKAIRRVVDNCIDEMEMSIDYGYPFEIGREIMNGKVYTYDQPVQIEIKLTITKKELERIMEGLK